MLALLFHIATRRASAAADGAMTAALAFSRRELPANPPTGVKLDLDRSSGRAMTPSAYSKSVSANFMPFRADDQIHPLE
jgi:hypothetical protein